MVNRIYLVDKNHRYYTKRNTTLVRYKNKLNLPVISSECVLGRPYTEKDSDGAKRYFTFILHRPVFTNCYTPTNCLRGLLRWTVERYGTYFINYSVFI